MVLADWNEKAVHSAAERQGEYAMSSWSKDELRKIVESDDLHISPFREDGVTYGTPTWIWSVVVDGNLYVRAYNGTSSSWYRRPRSKRLDGSREA